MKHTLASLVIGLSLLMGTASASAQDFQKGFAAANAGDFATALKEWRSLAEQGHTKPQFDLGVKYDYGLGVVQDHKEAAKWYRLAAEQGHTRAQYGLGAMYISGQDVIQEYMMAHMWFNIAASGGNANAAKHRDILAKRMTAADISKAQQLARECVAKNYKGC